jgi:hypothetical protein
MKMQDFKDEEMYVLVAPDGNWQAMTLAPDFASCVGQIRLLHKYGIGESFHELVKVKGFEILPVKVTIVQNGTAEEGFQKAKQKM